MDNPFSGLANYFSGAAAEKKEEEATVPAATEAEMEDADATGAFVFLATLTRSKIGRAAKKMVSGSVKESPKEAAKAEARMKRLVQPPLQAEILHDNVFGSESQHVVDWVVTADAPRVLGGEATSSDLSVLFMAVATRVLQGAGSPYAVAKYGTPDTLVVVPNASFYSPPAGRAWSKTSRRAVVFGFIHETTEAPLAAGVLYVDGGRQEYMLRATEGQKGELMEALDKSLAAARKHANFDVYSVAQPKVTEFSALPGLAYYAANALAGHEGAAATPGDDGSFPDSIRLVWLWRALGNGLPLPADRGSEAFLHEVRGAKGEGKSFISGEETAATVVAVDRILSVQEELKVHAAVLLNRYFEEGFAAVRADDAASAEIAALKVDALRRFGVLELWSPPSRYVLMSLSAGLVTAGMRKSEKNIERRLFSPGLYQADPEKAMLIVKTALLDRTGPLYVTARSRLLAGLIWLAEKMNAAKAFPGDNPKEGAADPDDALLLAYARTVLGDEKKADVDEAFMRKLSAANVVQERLGTDAELAEVANHSAAAMRMLRQFLAALPENGLRKPVSGEKARVEATREAYTKMRAPIKNNPVKVLSPWLERMWPESGMAIFAKREAELMSGTFGNNLSALVEFMNWHDVRDALAMAFAQKVRAMPAGKDAEGAAAALERFAEEQRGYDNLISIHARDAPAAPLPPSSRWARRKLPAAGGFGDDFALEIATYATVNKIFQI